MATPHSTAAGICWPVLTSPQNAEILAILFQLEQSQWWSPEVLLAHQLRQIHLLIKHAAHRVPFYKDRLQVVANIPTNEFTLEVLQTLPLLTRADIQNVGKALYARAIPKVLGECIRLRTSGSLGQPMVAVCTHFDRLFTRALVLRFHLWHRHDFSAKNVKILSIKKKYAKGPLSWVFCYPTGPAIIYDVTMPASQLLKNLLQEQGPMYLSAHPSSLRGMLEYSCSIKQAPQQLDAVCTFGEVVEDSLRELCQREWGVLIYDFYSSEEIGIMAIECPDAPVYHLQSEHMLVEILNDDNKPCKVGEMGRVVVTQLHNYAMPLIRYDIRDVAEVGAPCSCGRGLPVVRKIMGRVMNLVTLPNGDKLFPNFSPKLMVTIAPIKQYQLVQKDLNHIEVKLVVEKNLTAAQEAKLADYFSTIFRHQLDYHFIYCDDIPQQANGKYAVFRSEVE